MTTNPLLTLLKSEARLSDEEIAERLNFSAAEVRAQINAFENDGTILGYQAVIDEDRAGESGVSAFIEVKLTPERGGGFDRLAMRIARFDQVSSCYLASGGYDLMVVVEGVGLRDVAQFVSEKLSTLDGILSTATHFRLKAYKEKGFVFQKETSKGRLPVTP